MKIFELKEEDPYVIQEDELDEETATTIHVEHKKKISLEPNPWEHTYTLRSNGFIGHIPINENYALQIKPKVETKNIFHMLEYAYKLKSFELLEGSTHVKSINDFFERFVSILSKRVLDRNRKGLYSGYLQKEGSLPYLRGRVKILPTSISMLKGSTRATCRYEEHTSDLIENQILLWTLYQLRLFQIQREEVKKVVRKAYRELIHKVNLNQINPRDCINRFYNRLNEDYKPLHGLCRFFLEHVGPAIERGNYVFLPFVIYMPSLFESFVAEWLQQNLPSGIDLMKKFNFSLDSKDRFSFEIDLVLRDEATGRSLCVLDTKYKRSSEPENDDLNQINTYAIQMETKNAFLVYPSKDINPFDLKIGNVKIRSLVFDLSENPEKAGQDFLDELIRYVN